MAIENTLAINLHKSSASMPWVVVFEAPSGLTFEVSVGEDGNMAAGPRLQELLWEMDKKVVNYPTTYDMQHIGEVEKRRMQTRFMKDKPVFSSKSISSPSKYRFTLYVIPSISTVNFIGIFLMHSII